MIRYDIQPLDPQAHLFIIAITVPCPCKKEERFRLPNWISGSYLIRDFAQNVQDVHAFIGDAEVLVKKTSKNEWRVCDERLETGSALRLFYQYWAFDNSVRSAYLDDSRGFFNPGAVFMEPLCHSSERLLINISADEDCLSDTLLDWKVATSLPIRTTDNRNGWGQYEAQSYESLIDHPVELGNYEKFVLNIRNTEHTFIFSLLPVNCDLRRLRRDLKKALESVVEFFDPSGTTLPFENYTFLVNVTANGYGGLEHGNSCALMCPEKTLPNIHQKQMNSDYATFLGLVTHEYFHAWFVKRVRPVELLHPDFSTEVPSTLLWVFEGFTSFYDNLLLRRSGLIDNRLYSQLLTRDFRYALENSGSQHQSLAESSFDAWIKFYKPNANSRNAQVSYYKSGALAALCIDAQLRKLNHSLDEVMRGLWNQWQAAGKTYRGLTEDELISTINSVAGQDLSLLVQMLAHGHETPDYCQLLADTGICLEETPLELTRSLLGIEGHATEQGYVITHICDAELLQWTGFAPGDILIALDGIRIRATNLESLLSKYDAGDQLMIHAFRDDRLFERSVFIGAKKNVRSTVRIKGGWGKNLLWLKQS